MRVTASRIVDRKFRYMAETIALARYTAGASQDSVATALGFKCSQFISNCERGLASIPPEKFVKLSTFLDFPIHKLIEADLKDRRNFLEKITSKEQVQNEHNKNDLR
jgi:transcriptional regulator with XRE-family HTH domain